MTPIKTLSLTSLLLTACGGPPTTLPEECPFSEGAIRVEIGGDSTVDHPADQRCQNFSQYARTYYAVPLAFDGSSPHAPWRGTRAPRIGDCRVIEVDLDAPVGQQEHVRVVGTETWAADGSTGSAVFRVVLYDRSADNFDPHTGITGGLAVCDGSVALGLTRP